MCKQRIRPAAAADLPIMAELKCRRLSEQLSCFMPKEVLSRMSPEHFVQPLESMLEQACFRAAVHETDGRADGYLICARSQDSAPWDQIVEVFAESCELQQKLIDQALQTMREERTQHVHVWIIRDNFQLRFMYEMSGFRHGGTLGSKRFMGQDFPAVLYQCQLAQ